MVGDVFDLQADVSCLIQSIDVSMFEILGSGAWMAFDCGY